MKSTHEQQQHLVTRCGARIGMLNASWPLARLDASPERLVVGVLLLGSRVYARDQVEKINVHRGVVSRGLRIRDRKGLTPVIVWLRDPESLARTLRTWGYPVEL